MIWGAGMAQRWEHLNEGVVSKETVVLRRWGSSVQKFGFIRFCQSESNWIRSDEGLTLETSAFRISVRWPIYIINSVDKTKFLMRALASHQCGSTSIPSLGIKFGLSLLVLYSAPRGFSPSTPVFPSPGHLPWFALIVNFSLQLPQLALQR